MRSAPEGESTVTQPRWSGSFWQPHSTQRMTCTVGPGPSLPCAPDWSSSLPAENPLAMGDREGLDPGVRVERAQHPSHVVADGVGAQVELLRDLRSRVPVREQVQNFVLTRRQVRVGVGRGLRLTVRDDAEDADDPAALPEGTCADLDLDA